MLELRLTPEVSLSDFTSPSSPPAFSPQPAARTPQLYVLTLQILAAAAVPAPVFIMKHYAASKGCSKTR